MEQTVPWNTQPNIASLLQSKTSTYSGLTKVQFFSANFSMIQTNIEMEGNSLNIEMIRLFKEGVQKIYSHIPDLALRQDLTCKNCKH